MSFQTVFKRYELKYLLTTEQKEKILATIEPCMKLDKYGRTTICNIYFDTEQYLLIRRSIERPVYKEKLRVRTYKTNASNGTVFVELKKKYDHVVYKRRLATSEEKAMQWLSGEGDLPQQTQIAAEIEWFRRNYKTLRPAVFLSYEREAYYALDGSGFRVTFDENILGREEALNFETGIYGEKLLPDNTVLMEIKCNGGIPLWMTKILSEEKIYKTSFSKYGTLYRKVIFPNLSCGQIN